MLQFPLWKKLTVIAVCAGALVVALPNLAYDRVERFNDANLLVEQGASLTPEQQADAGGLAVLPALEARQPRARSARRRACARRGAGGRCLCRAHGEPLAGAARCAARRARRGGIGAADRQRAGRVAHPHRHAGRHRGGAHGGAGGVAAGADPDGRGVAGLRGECGRGGRDPGHALGGRAPGGR